MQQLKKLINEPLLHLAGGPVTLASLLFGVTMVVGSYLLAGLASRAVTGLLMRRDVAPGARFALAKMTHYVVVLIGTLVAVTSLGVRLDALLAASTVLLVGIGFGLQNIAQNFVSGLILLIERPVATATSSRSGRPSDRWSTWACGRRAWSRATRSRSSCPTTSSITGAGHQPLGSHDQLAHHGASRRRVRHRHASGQRRAARRGARRRRAARRTPPPRCVSTTSASRASISRCWSGSGTRATTRRRRHACASRSTKRSAPPASRSHSRSAIFISRPLARDRTRGFGRIELGRRQVQREARAPACSTSVNTMSAPNSSDESAKRCCRISAMTMVKTSVGITAVPMRSADAPGLVRAPGDGGARRARCAAGKTTTSSATAIAERPPRKLLGAQVQSGLEEVKRDEERGEQLDAAEQLLRAQLRQVLAQCVPR